MNKFEDDDDMMKFSWVGLFSVTGFCCFLFSFFMKLINETNVFPFMKIGGFSLALAFVLYMHNYFNSRNTKKIRQEVQSTSKED